MRWTSWWRVLCLLCFLGWSSGLGAAELMDTGTGKLLVGFQPQEAGGERTMERRLRDPFNWSDELIEQHLARTRGMQELFAGLELSGIVWDPQTPLAIINQTLVKQGGNVENATVVRISKDSVLLAREGALHTLNFQQGIIDLGAVEVKGDERSVERK